MKRVIEFLQKNELQYFATVGLDGNAKVRPFQMMFEEGGKIYYCTGAKKEVYKELQKNPCFELCVSTKARWLRLTGRAEFIDDKRIKQKILDTSPLVNSIYKTADNPELIAFYIADGTAVFTDFSGKPPEVIKL